MNEAIKISIATEYITLGQFLKFAKIIGNGGEAKTYLALHAVKVNGEPESRRGRKLRPGDEVLVEKKLFAVS